MYSKTLRTSFFLLFAALGLVANAQEYSKNIFSPYTLYGIGQLSQPGFSNTRGMGDAGIGMRSRYMINHLNPAALTAQDTATFIVDFGIESNNIYAATKDRKTSFNGFGFDHLSIAFPISKRIVTAITIQPMTQVGYRVAYDETNPEVLAQVGNVSYEFFGKGGINIGQIGVGVKVYKGLSVGANFNVYFGSIDRDYNKIFPASNPLYLSSYTTSRVMVSNVGFSTGLSYAHQIDDDKFINFGATYQPKLNISASATELSTGSSVIDTNSYNHSRIDFGIPAKMGVGVSFGKKYAFTFSGDYEFTQWDKVSAIDKYSEYVNTNAFRAGVEYIPNIRDFRNYFNRITYRLGVRYSDLYFKVNGQKTNDMAVTAGLGIPIRGLSYVNTSFEFGQRGTISDGGIRERYFTFTVGISLFDNWFLKPMFY